MSTASPVPTDPHHEERQAPCPPRRRGRPRSDEGGFDRAHLLEAALHAFAIHGYQGVSIRTLARELGVSHNLLNQRFGSKQDLWYAAVDHGFGSLTDELQRVMTGTGDWYAQLHAAITAFIRHSARNPDLLRLVDTEGATPSERLDHLVDRFIAPATSPLRRHLRTAPDGESLPLRSLHFLITRGGAALYSSPALARSLDEGDTTDPFAAEEIEQHAKFVADVIVEGIRARTSGGVSARSGTSDD
ncbi:TetR/AcrR family transcriptional regulator [Streptomyces eurythermus]